MPLATYCNPVAARNADILLDFLGIALKVDFALVPYCSSKFRKSDELRSVAGNQSPGDSQLDPRSFEGMSIPNRGFTLARKRQSIGLTTPFYSFGLASDLHSTPAKTCWPR